jgi:tetratricopeptide (TPR) repeat protein
VIEPFDSPPALVAHGVTGKVLANSLLDDLTRLRSSTHVTDYVSNRAVQSAWSSDAQIIVPETGISVGELSRILKSRFGHDLHISGDLVETPTGSLALTVRGDGVPPKTFSGQAIDLEKLTSDAAEYVYGQSQPVPWLSYLASHGRSEEAIAFAKQAFVRTDKEDRPRLLVDWAIALNELGRFREALPLLRQAIALNPEQYYSGYHILADTLANLGDEEGAWQAGEDMRRAAGGRPGRAAEVKFDVWDNLTWNLLAERDAYVADRDSNGGVGIIYNEGVGIAGLDAFLHDREAAEVALQTTTDDPNNPDVIASIHFIKGQLAADAGDGMLAASEMEAFGATCTPQPGCAGASCWIAPAEESVGHPDKADAALKAGGTFVDCYRFRADVLYDRGDWKGAQEWYAKSVELAPDLPAGYYSWGLALARHGDLAGAVAKLKDANQRGPHWADPLKAWGDILAKQGKIKDALVKYDEALKYAPNWKQLKEAREAVAKQKS